MESRPFSPTGPDALPRLDANIDTKDDARTPSAPLEGDKDAMELDNGKAIQQVGPNEEDASGASEVKDNNNIPVEQLEEGNEKKKEGKRLEEDVASGIKEEVSPISVPAGTLAVTSDVTTDNIITDAAGGISAPAVSSALMTTPPPRQPCSPDMSERLPVSQSQLSTPQQQVENMRRAAEACRPALVFSDIPPPSPIVEPGALHELGDPTSPHRRRSSANAGIAGLEELRRDRMDQLIHATGFDGAGENSQEPEYEHTIDAFIKLNFDDGNVYYVKNSSVIFGRMEGATSNTFQQIGPDGSTVIGGGSGFGFEHPTTPGAMGMKREKKKRRKKKDGVGSKKSKSTTSGGSSAAPATSHEGSAFQGQPQFPLFRDPFGFRYSDHGNHFTQEDETAMIYLPPPNPSGEQEVTSAAPPKKNISRKHARLAYNAVRGWFELDIMGKNGAFVNEEFVQVGTKLIIDPKEGTKVQIGGVSFVVYVPEHLEGGPEVIEPPAASGGMGKGKGGKGKGGKGKSAKGKTAFSFSDDNSMESDLSDPDAAMSDDGNEDSANGSGDSGENERGEESDQNSDEEDFGGEEGDLENSEEAESSGEEGGEDSPSPEPAKVEKRGRGRPRKDQTEARRKETAKEKAAAERAKVKERERRQREKLEAQRRERELEKEREKKRLEAQQQKEERRRQKERSQKGKEKEKKKIHLPASAKGGGGEAKKERKLYLPPPPSAKSEKPSAPTQERKGPGRPPKEKKYEVQTQAPLQPSLQQPPPSTQQPQENSTNPEDTEMYHPSYHEDLQELAPLAAANLAMSMPIDPALSFSFPQPAPIVYEQAPKEQKKKGKQKKEKPPPKRKRSPSPEINEADFPPEALLKPSASYVVLIHEAISSSERGALTLPEIYKAIERKYPYYKLKVTTNGWQSSIRHNLGQHRAFYKVERSGKGWLWGCTKGVSIEKEKKGSTATRSISSASYASGIGISNGYHNSQGGQVPSVQSSDGAPSQSIPQPPLQYLQYPQSQQLHYQQAPPAPETAPTPRPPPTYYAPIPSAASLRQQQHMLPPQQQPPANAQSSEHSPDFNEAIIGLQALIQQHKDAPGPRSPELLNMATEVVRSLMDKDPGAMEAIKKLTALIKQIDQAKVVAQSPVLQQQYQQQHGQTQTGKGKGVAASAVGITATAPTPIAAAQPARQNNHVSSAPVAASNHALAAAPQANKHSVPINIKDLSPEEKAALVKRLLLAKKQKEQAVAAAAAAVSTGVSPVGPSATVSAPAFVASVPTQAPSLHASPPVVKPVSAPIPIITPAAPADSTQLPTNPTSTKRPREHEPEPRDLEAKRQNTG